MKEQEIRIALAGKLAKFRKNAGLNIEEVGKAVGKSPKTVSGWEHGRGQPDADTLFHLCDLYGISNISVFFTDEHYDADDLPADEKRMLDYYRQLNDEGRTKLIDYADDLVRSGKYIKAGSPAMGKEA